MTGPTAWRGRIDPDYYRRKAALCRELARDPAHRSCAKILLNMAKRFASRGDWPLD